ncbi:Alternative oxidase 1a, mitochondrial [Hordeum vulgare]|nr:Alternative oxidase 1a, mitochondrial [Hordeum vulgare]
MVVDEMSTSFSDETYMSIMGVGSNNSHWSQTNEVHFHDHEFDVDEDGEGIVGVSKGRAGNYTMDEDVLLCNTLLQVSRDATVGGDQSRDAYWIRMKEHFDLHNKSGIDRSKRSLRSRWSTISRDCQRWTAAHKAVDTLNPSGTNDRDRLREGVNEDSNKCKRTIDLDDDKEETSSDDGKRSPTPNSVAYYKPKRPNEGKKDAEEKNKRKGDDELKNAMEAIVNAKKEANELGKMARNQDVVAEERRLAAEERRVATVERRVAAEERKVAFEEKKLAMEE